MPGFDNELERIVTQLNRAVPASGKHAQVTPPGTAERVVPPLPGAAPGGSCASDKPAPSLKITAASANALDQLLGFAGERNASDLLLVAESPAIFRVHGGLAPATTAPLTSEEIENLLLPALTPEQQRELRTKKSLDFGFLRSNGVRCRANVHYQRGTLAACIRILPAKVPSLESLHLPASLAKFLDRRQGLVLVTGPTGCGKTTTLAALIDLLNRRNRFHIVTIEDPIEYHYANALSVVEQIEVGRDTPDFVNSLRSILRQNPDAILVGEMRDAETMSTVLTAAETGHLVFSTLHTNDTGQAVSRILDSFAAAAAPQVRQQLSLALTAIVAQQLVPGTDGVSRFPAVEIMVATDAVRSLIRRGDDHQLRLQLSIGRAEGMMTMEQSLAELVRAGRIARDTALAHCFRPDDLRHHLE
jgi:twitching motility protein PilT